MNAKDKQALIKWIESLEDEATLEKLRFIKEHHIDAGDWWNTLSGSEQASIERGIADLNAGRITLHTDVKMLYKNLL